MRDSLFLGDETASIVANTEVEINPVIFTVSDLGYSGPPVASAESIWLLPSPVVKVLGCVVVVAVHAEEALGEASTADFAVISESIGGHNRLGDEAKRSDEQSKCGNHCR